MKDSKILRELKVANGAKLMLVGSKITAVMEVTNFARTATYTNRYNLSSVLSCISAAAAAKEPLCKQKMHKKVLDKGKPEDAMPGIKKRKVGYLLK